MPRNIQKLCYKMRFPFVVLVLYMASYAMIPRSQAQSPETCVAYMEADAVYESTLAELMPSNMFRDFMEFIFGPSEPVATARQRALVERDKTLRAAYGGPTSTIESVMDDLISDDRSRCDAWRWGE